jgi:hypothetical protein
MDKKGLTEQYWVASVPQPGLEAALNHKLYQPVDDGVATPSCFVQTETPTRFDLSRLCGIAPANATVNSSEGSGYSSNGGGSSGGICNTPTDRARDGSLCGGRAASERKGGR